VIIVFVSPSCACGVSVLVALVGEEFEVREYRDSPQLRIMVSTTICRPKYLLLGDPSETPLTACPNRSKAFVFPFFMARVARDNISLIASLHQIHQHMSPPMTLSHTSFDVWLLRLGWLLYITIYIFTQVVNPFSHGYLGYQPQ
jgi:hypothetical protein